MLPTGDSLSKDTQRLKVKWQEKIHHAKGNKKKTGLAILLSDKGDFLKSCKRQNALHNKGIKPTRRYNTYKYLIKRIILLDKNKNLTVIQ